MHTKRDCPDKQEVASKDIEMLKQALLCLFNQASLDSLNAYPLTFYSTTCSANANALYIWLESAFCLLNELQTDTATLLALTFVDNFATLNWTLTCD